MKSPHINYFAATHPANSISKYGYSLNGASSLINMGGRRSSKYMNNINSYEFILNQEIGFNEPSEPDLDELMGIIDVE